MNIGIKLEKQLNAILGQSLTEKSKETRSKTPP